MNKYCVEENPYIREKFLFKYSDFVDGGNIQYLTDVEFLIVPDKFTGYLDLKLDCYSPNGGLWFFKLEDDDAAKLIFELGEYK